MRKSRKRYKLEDVCMPRTYTKVESNIATGIYIYIYSDIDGSESIISSTPSYLRTPTFSQADGSRDNISYAFPSPKYGDFEQTDEEGEHLFGNSDNELPLLPPLLPLSLPRSIPQSLNPSSTYHFSPKLIMNEWSDVPSSKFNRGSGWIKEEEAEIMTLYQEELGEVAQRGNDVKRRVFPFLPNPSEKDSYILIPPPKNRSRKRNTWEKEINTKYENIFYNILSILESYSLHSPLDKQLLHNILIKFGEIYENTQKYKLNSGEFKNIVETTINSIEFGLRTTCSLSQEISKEILKSHYLQKCPAHKYSLRETKLILDLSGFLLGKRNGQNVIDHIYKLANARLLKSLELKRGEIGNLDIYSEVEEVPAVLRKLNLTSREVKQLNLFYYEKLKSKLLPILHHGITENSHQVEA